MARQGTGWAWSGRAVARPALVWLGSAVRGLARRGSVWHWQGRSPDRQAPGFKPPAGTLHKGRMAGLGLAGRGISRRGAASQGVARPGVA